MKTENTIDGNDGFAFTLESVFGDVSVIIPQERNAIGECDAIDRVLGLRDGDVLLCEATCLYYAEHVLDSVQNLGELWLIPPRQHPWDAMEEDAAEESLERMLGSWDDALPFKGFMFAPPDSPFKLLVTTQYRGVPIEPAINWPRNNPFWDGMLNTEGAVGAAIFPPLEEQEESYYSLLEGNIEVKGLSRVAELPGGRFILGFDKTSETCFMEDLSNPDEPWEREVAPFTIAVNDGCLVPSMYRTEIEVLEETTIGALASRISRGTSLSEKDLEIVEKLDGRVVEPAYETTSDGRLTWQSTGHSGSFFVRRDDWVAAEEDDLYYVDGSCFNDGEIWPIVLESIPKGQERYVVDRHDGEVLLVSRNSKQAAVYRALRPTLIANSVFVIRLDSDISRDYLACWLRGRFAKDWLLNKGKILSKGVLSSLPVPILGEEAMELAVRHERAIDDRLFELREAIERLKWGNRFAPLAAAWEGSDSDDRSGR